MHTTTSWSSPPPAWRGWEVWGRKHSAWSSTRRHGARRAADTRSPVPAPYRRRSEGRETQKQMHVSPSGGPSRARRHRGGTHRGASKAAGNAGKEFFFFFKKKKKGFVVLLHRRCGGCSACGDWRSQIWQRVWGRSAQVTPCRHVPSSSHAEAGGEAGGEAVRPAWVSRRLDSFLAPLLLTGVKTKLFTFYQPDIFACAMQRLLMRALNYTLNNRLGLNYFILFNNLLIV